MNNIKVRNFLGKVGMVTVLSLYLPTLQAASDDIEREFTVQPGGRFVLNSDGGEVNVRTGTDNRIHVLVRNPDDMEVTFEQNNNDVYVEAVLDGRRNRIRTTFEVQVPEQFNLELQTQGGSITVASMRGDVDAQTAGGSISIGDVIGSVEAQTAGGSVTLGTISGAVRAQTAGGSINIDNVGGDVEAETAGGSITVGNVDGNADLQTAGGSVTAGFVVGSAEMTTAGGSINLEGSGTEVDAETAGGSITVDRSDGPVTASTAGGSIVLGPVSGSIDARTAGGSVTAELIAVPAGTDTSISMVTAGGDIELRLPRDHGASVDAHIEVSRRYRGDYRIYTDFPLTIQGEDGRDVTARGDINGGGDPIRLETANGDIRILAQ